MTAIPEDILPPERFEALLAHANAEWEKRPSVSLDELSREIATKRAAIQAKLAPEQKKLSEDYKKLKAAPNAERGDAALNALMSAGKALLSLAKALPEIEKAHEISRASQLILDTRHYVRECLGITTSTEKKWGPKESDVLYFADDTDAESLIRTGPPTRSAPGKQGVVELIHYNLKILFNPDRNAQFDADATLAADYIASEFTAAIETAVQQQTASVTAEGKLAGDIKKAYDNAFAQLSSYLPNEFVERLKLHEQQEIVRQAEINAANPQIDVDASELFARVRRNDGRDPT